MLLFDLVFGFGRRTCPGMQFAEGTTFANIATTLATCDILPELDDDSKPIIPELKWSDGVISYVILSVPERRPKTDLRILLRPPDFHRISSVNCGPDHPRLFRCLLMQLHLRSRFYSKFFSDRIIQYQSRLTICNRLLHVYCNLVQN